MARGKAGARIIVTLGCTDCRERNYTTSKNRHNDPDRMEFTKYCPRCRGGRMHREVR
jgi:large subunit ribosomal protein L33